MDTQRTPVDFKQGGSQRLCEQISWITSRGNPIQIHLLHLHSLSHVMINNAYMLRMSG
jgi:hypothetical protein